MSRNNLLFVISHGALQLVFKVEEEVLGSISAALSCLVRVLSRTAAGDRA